MLGVRTLLLIRDTVRVSSTRTVPSVSVRMSSSESCRNYEVCSLQFFLLPVLVILIFNFLAKNGYLLG